MNKQDPVIVAKPSELDLIVGPLFFGGVLGGAGAFGIARIFWEADKIIDHWEVILFFVAIFIPVFLLIRKINSSRSFWKIENGTIYRGGKALFQLNEIVEAQVGLPDNYINLLERLPVKLRGSGGIAYAAFARKQVTILKLKQNRWFLWSGLQYQNYEQFRNALLAAAPVNAISHFSEAILPQIRITSINKILYE